MTVVLVMIAAMCPTVLTDPLPSPWGATCTRTGVPRARCSYASLLLCGTSLFHSVRSRETLPETRLAGGEAKVNTRRELQRETQTGRHTAPATVATARSRGSQHLSGPTTTHTKIPKHARARQQKDWKSISRAVPSPRSQARAMVWTGSLYWGRGARRCRAERRVCNTHKKCTKAR